MRELSAAEQRRLSRTAEMFFRAAEKSPGEGQPMAFTRRLIRAAEDPETGILYCTFAQDMRGTAVLNFISTLAVYGGEVIAVQGSWCFAQLDTSYSAQLLDQINILYNVKNRILEEREAGGSEIVTVSALSLEYAAYFRSDTDHYYLIPVWQAEKDDGKSYIINAVDGAFYTNSGE